MLAVPSNKAHTSCSLFRTATSAIRNYYFIRKLTLGDSSYSSYGVEPLRYLLYQNYTLQADPRIRGFSIRC